ncbi:MAG: hypothetical protein NZ869_06830 [Thermoanaerobaculum sp.]|nr:hypothetical protein [Thermoanaerobaculum sp.]MDW7966579.1 DUF6677 family protein [Thermoanaerobaculum sp.]
MSSPSVRRTPLPVALLVALAWLFPGLGHALLGRRQRALVFAGVVVVGFAVGLACQGELILPKSGDPLSYFAAVATIGNGILFLLAKLLALGQGIPTATTYEYGNAFLLTAGIMNLLLMLDTYDIAVGKKDW